MDDAARVAGGGAPNRIYSAKELVRRAAEPGPYHNFPESFNARIFGGNRQVISENYVLYTERGSINGVNGHSRSVCGLLRPAVRKRSCTDSSVLTEHE
jgi:hypothetical protein